MAGCRRESRAVIVLVLDQREVPVGTIAGATRCDFELVDAILRLQLAAAAMGLSIQLRDVQPELRELVELSGCGAQLGM
jgi:hypothetical protein